MQHSQVKRKAETTKPERKGWSIPARSGQDRGGCIGSTRLALNAWRVSQFAPRQIACAGPVQFPGRKSRPVPRISSIRKGYSNSTLTARFT